MFHLFVEGEWFRCQCNLTCKALFDLAFVLARANVLLSMVV